MSAKTNQRKIVKTLTNNFREKITIDRIRVSDEKGQEYMTIEEEEIRHQTELYYQSAFRRRNNNFDIFDPEWKKQYEPKPEINEAWYEGMEQKITLEELKETLQDLPNDKAAGPFKVKYEMLKHLGNIGKKNTFNSL